MKTGYEFGPHMMNETYFKLGDIVYRIGNTDKFVVTAYDCGGVVLDLVYLGHLIKFNMWVGPKRMCDYVKTGTWDYANEREIDARGCG